MPRLEDRLEAVIHSAEYRTEIQMDCMVSRRPHHTFPFVLELQNVLLLSSQEQARERGESLASSMSGGYLGELACLRNEQPVICGGRQLSHSKINGYRRMEERET